MYGDEQEAFLSHMITKSEDFYQVCKEEIIYFGRFIFQIKISDEKEIRA